MNESETRAEYIDPKLREVGWGEVEGSKILREFRITDGKIQTGGTRGKPEIIDYVLQYKNRKIGTVEAKSIDFSVTEGKEQAVSAAKKLQIDYAFSSNGKEIYQVEMKNGAEVIIEKFPTPDELWGRTFLDWNEWKDKFTEIPFQIFDKMFLND